MNCRRPIRLDILHPGRALVSLALLFALQSLHGDDRYRVEFSPALDRVDVQACFEGAAPGSLHRNDDAHKYAGAVIGSDGRRLAVRSGNGKLRLPKLPADACIAWSIDLSAALAAGDYRLAFRFGGSLLTAGDLWFWRDNERRPLVVKVILPNGLNFSTPWRRTANVQHFRPHPTPPGWSSRMAVGDFPVTQLPTVGGSVELAAIGRLTARQQRKVQIWIQETVDSLSTVIDRFPQQHAQVLVVPIGPRNEAVPWAHVLRGGGIGIEFFVDENRPLDDFRSDWTATHEFSHLLLPRISGQDRWLSEGLASYYQNVLRARDGRLSEQEAWQKLHEGFERGRTGGYRGSLAKASSAGFGATMRIYWSGAAILLKADAELRRQTDGRQSLDTALKSLNDCCIDPGENWRARELLQRLDELTGTAIFDKLYDQHVYDTRFPDVSKTLAFLGVDTRDERVRIENDAPWWRIRYYIMNG